MRAEFIQPVTIGRCWDWGRGAWSKEFKSQTQPVGIPYAGYVKGKVKKLWSQTQPVGIPYAGERHIVDEENLSQTQPVGIPYAGLMKLQE